VGEVEELCDPSIELTHIAGMLLPNGRTYRGSDGLREYFADIHEAWDEIEFISHSVDRLGDEEVLVEGRVVARSWVWRLREGRFACGRLFDDRDQAVRGHHAPT
jgi:ketosteroid isomerase-like protein